MLFSKFLDPKNDYAFKRIFGTEKNKDILIDFINAVVEFENNSNITDIVLLETSQNPEIAYKKQSLIDVLCKDELGRQYIIEMQVAKTAGFEKRAQYYAAKAYSRQLNQGEPYQNLRAVIFVAITDFVMFPDKPHYLSQHVILDKETYEQDLKDFSFTFLELPKFNKPIANLQNVIERWCYFFKRAEGTHERDINDIAGVDKAIARAYEELNRYSWDEDELHLYEREEKRVRDEQAVFKAQLDDAKAEGLAEGKAKGKAEGIVEGKRQTAKNLLALGMEHTVVAQATGLSESQITSLLNNKG